MPFRFFYTNVGIRLYLLCSLFPFLCALPSFASEQSGSPQLMAQRSSYQESTLSISDNDLRNGVSLMISGQSSSTSLSLKVQLNGKTVRWISGTSPAKISLNSCFANQSRRCVIDITGSYSPSYSGLLTEIVTGGSSSQQETGGSGVVSQRLQVLVR
jgi:hypothetical protein